MDPPRLRALSAADTAAVTELYRTVALSAGSGLARSAPEITAEYVEGFLSRAARNGVALGALQDERLVGEIHAVRMSARQFSHVLSELTVAVDPLLQGCGIGSLLFDALFGAAARLSPPVCRIELIARSGNAAAIRLYERLGFRIEGRFVGRVRLADGTIEDDIPMARCL